MVNSEKDWEAFAKKFKEWEMCIVDVVGQSHGLLSTWIPRVINVTPFLIFCRNLVGRKSFRMGVVCKVVQLLSLVFREEIFLEEYFLGG